MDNNLTKKEGKMNSYELFYDTGGHGGPYFGFTKAKTAARQLLAGCPSINRIHVINRKEWARNPSIMKASFVVIRKKPCWLCGRG